MQDQIRSLAAHGYRHGYTNGHGADGTVSGIEYALSHLGPDATAGFDTAMQYSLQSAVDLEYRLFAAYATRCLALIASRELKSAREEYERANGLIALVNSRGAHRLNADDAAVEAVLAVLERRLRQAEQG